MAQYQNQIDVQLNAFLNQNSTQIDDITSPTKTSLKFIQPSSKLLKTTFEKFYIYDNYKQIKSNIIIA